MDCISEPVENPDHPTLLEQDSLIMIFIERDSLGALPLRLFYMQILA
jgi:hypothetical protein